jgi:hypothetical protein
MPVSTWRAAPPRQFLMATNASHSASLDHRGAFHRHGHARERLPIGLDGGKVDGEDAAGFRWVGSLGRHVDGPQVEVVDGHSPRFMARRGAAV